MPCWDIYIKACQDYFGFSPTRGLDDNSIKLESSAAFPSTLAINNKPIETLTKDKRVLSHVSMGFVFIVEESLMLSIYEYFHTMDIIGRKIENQSDYFLVISGTVSNWINCILTICDTDNKKLTLRKMANELFNILVRAGFKVCFDKFEKIQLFDGSFILGGK